MRHFPLFMDLSGRTVLVVGAGELAERKAEPLRRAGAVVRLRPTFDPCDLDGCALAIGADAPEPDKLALSFVAKSCGIPVNVVDRSDLCSFIMPAIIDRDPVTIAISTGGTAPLLARLLRQRIEAIVPPAIGRLANLAGRFSGAIRRRFPDFPARRCLLERIFTGRVAELVLAGDERGAELALSEELAANTAPSGIVHLVSAGPGAADLLTLRAHRLLGEAEVIVHDRSISVEVLNMARHDAECIVVGKTRANHSTPQRDIVALLIRLANEGKRVVRLKGGDPSNFGCGGEEAEALTAAGVTFEIVPGITAALIGGDVRTTQREAFLPRCEKAPASMVRSTAFLSRPGCV